MKILLIHNYYRYFGGEDSYVNSLKEILSKNNHKVIIYAKKSTDVKTIFDKIKVAINMFWNFKVQKEINEIIIKNKPDIVHIHNLFPSIGPTAYWICKRNTIPIVQHIHNYRFVCPKGIMFRNGKICTLCIRKNFSYYSIIFGCYSQSRIASAFISISYLLHKLIKTFDLIDKYIFPSKFIQELYLKHLNIDKAKTSYLNYFTEAPKVSHKNKKRDYFLYIGRLSEEKGIIKLLPIFVKLKYKFIIVGDGPLRSEIIPYAKYSNIVYLGQVFANKKNDLIAQAKAVIIPSVFFEIGPITLLESFSNGTPVIVPNEGIFKERVINNKTGFFFNNIKELIEKIHYVHKNMNLNRIKKFEKEEYESNYTEHKHYKLLLEIYLSINTLSREIHCGH